MRKGKLLNSSIVSTLSRMGHTDQLTIGDAGLPIPEGVNRIDLALINGLPSFIDTVRAIEADMVVEKIILAEEIKDNNPSVLEAIKVMFETIEIEYVSHEQFKKLSGDSKAVVRTGECTPYANIILQSGVDFSEA